MIVQEYLGEKSFCLYIQQFGYSLHALKNLIYCEIEGDILL